MSKTVQIDEVAQFHSEWSRLDKTNKVLMLKREQKSLVDYLRYLTHAYRSKGGFTPIESQTYDNVMEMIKYWETEKSHDDV